MAADYLLSRGTHMRNHEDSDGTALKASGAFQQSLIVRGNSGDEAIRAAGCGDGGHGVCVPKCATLCAGRKSGFWPHTPAKIPFSVALGRSAASAFALSGL